MRPSPLSSMMYRSNIREAYLPQYVGFRRGNAKACALPAHDASPLNRRPLRKVIAQASGGCCDAYSLVPTFGRSRNFDLATCGNTLAGLTGISSALKACQRSFQTSNCSHFQPRYFTSRYAYNRLLHDGGILPGVLGATNTF